MKQIEVSREFLEEFEIFKGKKHRLSHVFWEVENNEDWYPKIFNYLFFNTTLGEDNVNQLEFAEVWAGKAEYVVKEQLYYVNLPYVGYLSKQGVTAYKNHAKVFTEQEIKDINPAYLNDEFLVKVED